MTGDYRRLKRASHNFLRRMLRKPAWSFKRFVADRRSRQGRRWNFVALLESLLYGYLSNRSSLRAVERLTEISRGSRIPDTTLYDFVSRFGSPEVAGLRQQLQAQVRSDWRSKSLTPVGVPCGVVAIDNKTVWTGSPKTAPAEAQVVHPPEQPAYAQLRMTARC